MDSKDKYLEKIEKQLHEWKLEIDTLKAKAGNAETHLQADLHRKIDQLKEKQDTTEAKLKELKDAGEESWENFKIGYEELRDDLKKSIENAHTSF